MTKVFSSPVPAPEIDYKNYNTDKVMANEAAHRKALELKLAQLGYTGPNTGKIYSTPMADGCAQYMLAERGKMLHLFHLPYGDAWHSPDVQHLPRAEILRRVIKRESFPSMFVSRDLRAV